jgi:hypothetical protein
MTLARGVTVAIYAAGLGALIGYANRKDREYAPCTVRVVAPFMGLWGRLTSLAALVLGTAWFAGDSPWTFVPSLALAFAHDAMVAKMTLDFKKQRNTGRHALWYPSAAAAMAVFAASMTAVPSAAPSSIASAASQIFQYVAGLQVVLMALLTASAV